MTQKFENKLSAVELKCSITNFIGEKYSKMAEENPARAWIELKEIESILKDKGYFEPYFYEKETKNIETVKVEYKGEQSEQNI